MAFRLGKDAKAYIAGATAGFANLVEMTNVKDLTLNHETGEADTTTRANAGWRSTMATLREATAEFEMVWDSADANFAKIQAAWMASTTLEAAFLTGDVAGAPDPGIQGPYAHWSVTNFSRSEPLEEAITVSVTMKVTTWIGWVADGTDPTP